MINSIGGTAYFNNFKAVKLRGNNSLRSFGSFGQADNIFGITEEQKDYLKRKYGSSHLNLQDDTTRELMEELKEMGAITEQDFNSYDCPSWPCPDNRAEARRTTREAADFNGDIRDIFRILGKDMEEEGQNAFGDARQVLLKQKDTYNKLADLMDYIFN